MRAPGAPLTAIRLIDDTPRLIRAPEVMFEAAEIGLEAFGHNIENRHLVAALDRRAAALPRLRRIAAAVTAVEPGDDGVTVRLDDGGTIAARLVVGADGRKSLCRAAAGIETERRSYPQAALTLNLGHTRPHNGISTEFHTESGPFTLVPLPGLRSSLVCVVDPAEAEQSRRARCGCAVRRDRAARAFDPRQDRGRGRARAVSARRSKPREASRRDASRWSAKPRM